MGHWTSQNKDGGHGHGLVNVSLNHQSPIVGNRQDEVVGGGWGFYVDNVEFLAWQTAAFSVDECQKIIELGESRDLHQGTIGNGELLSMRKSQVRFLFPSSETNWIFDRLCGVAALLNQRYFGFDLQSFNEGLQFTKYESNNDHYDWHLDVRKGSPPRKLSLSVQLSDPSSYAGGSLEIKTGASELLAPKNQGDVCAFPSYMLHRVAPVTHGTRHSLVAWVYGPPFK